MSSSTITADVDGRQLRFTVVGVAPFVIPPLPGEAGAQVTDVYLRTPPGRC